MPIYKIDNTSLTHLHEKQFQIEKNIQTLTEKNLQQIFGLEFISSEFSVKNVRMDSIAFDNETKAFVIIEYKKSRSFSIIDQGYSYLSTMLNNKADFVLEYNEKKNCKVKRDDIDWSQSRIIFIAESYTAHQINSINFRDLPIELWEIKLFDNDLFQINRIINESTQSIKPISSNPIIDSVSNEIKDYSLDDHLHNATEKAALLFYELREKILSISSNIQERYLKTYIAFKTNKNFTEIQIQKDKLKLFIDIKHSKLDDPKKIARDIKNIGRHGTGETEVVLADITDIDYIISLIKQAYYSCENS